MTLVISTECANPPTLVGGSLVVKPSGKYWRMKYRFNGKEGSPLAIGVYPAVSLKQARGASKELLRKNIDPNQAKKADKRKPTEEAQVVKFEGVAKEWVVG